jgi:CheY-like chemotaxis protein
VLVVDDDEDIREALQTLLEDEGYRVLLARNGLDALTCLRGGERPCVILLDLMMPVMTGWAFRDEQLQDPLLAPIPVIVITAAHRPAPPVTRILYKPLRADDLLSVIRTFC